MINEEKSAVKAVGLMMMITLIGKILGLMREQFLAGYYSIGMEAVAFMTASRIPRIFFDAIFASAISASFIPVFSEYLTIKGKKEAFSLADSFINLIIFFTVIITVLGVIFAPYLTEFFADGYDAQTAELCTRLLRMLFPTVIFTGVAFSFVGILQSMEEFTIPAAMSIASNGIVILYYIFFNDKFGVYGLAFAFLIGWAAQAAIQIPALLKKGYRYKPRISFKDLGLKKIFILMLPVMVGTWIQPINIAINAKFASRLYSGSGVAAVEYANNLYTIIAGIFVLSVANVIFPRLSRLSVKKDEKSFMETITGTLRALAIFLIPMTAGLMALSYDIVRIIYERGEFTPFATEITSKALFYFAIGMFGFGIYTLLSRAYYSSQKGGAPLVAGIFTIAVNAGLSVILMDKMDVGGLALANGISSLFSAAALLVFMHMKNKNFITSKLCLDIIKILAASLVMFLAVAFLRDNFLALAAGNVLKEMLALLIISALGGILYFICVRALGLDEAKLVTNFIRTKIER